MRMTGSPRMDDRSYSAVLVEADNCSALTGTLAELFSLGEHGEDGHRGFGASRRREMSSSKPRTMKKKPTENLRRVEKRASAKKMALEQKFCDKNFSGKEGRRKDPRYLSADGFHGPNVGPKNFPVVSGEFK
ncbi:hypothetical protein KSP39_PZI008495 [Platanthera zijinensis]|uniref:Uncharacterized protein n=1 Tax=Platanthera zijinensis TaxID=2320716 RepID=A0AAP0BQ69_9ASPA